MLDPEPETRLSHTRRQGTQESTQAGALAPRPVIFQPEQTKVVCVIVLIDSSSWRSSSALGLLAGPRKLGNRGSFAEAAALVGALQTQHATVNRWP